MKLSRLAKIGAIQADHARLGELSFYSWFIGVFFSLIHSVIQYQRVQEGLKKAKNTKERTALRGKRINVVLDIIRNLADLHLSSAASGFHKYNGAGLTGVSGSIASGIAIYQAWNS
jgi:hypothetical protein